MAEELAKDMFINPRMLNGRDSAFAISVVTCVLCGSLVADASIHQEMHQNHGHVGLGFSHD